MTTALYQEYGLLALAAIYICGKEPTKTTAPLTKSRVFHDAQKLYVSQAHGSHGICGAPRGLGDLGRMAFYFQGAGEHW